MISKILIFSGFLLALISLASAAHKLKQHNIDPTSVTTSGISSGGAMAMQYHFAHSASISGAGIFAGGPYLCGFNGFGAATLCLQTPNFVPIAPFITQANLFSAVGAIDKVSNLKNSKVYIFHGSKDSVVRPGSGKLVERMYKNYNADIHAEFSIPAEHGQPTDNIGGPCGTVNPGYLNNCGYNGAFEALNFLYGGNLIRPNRSDTDFKLSSELQVFDQEEYFFFDPKWNGMDDIGFVYIPERCKSGEIQCKLHIVYHGCMSSRTNMGTDFATKTGYLEAADLNDIILLFPQVKPSAVPVNPMGCWDWFYYTGPEFPLKEGDQIEKIFMMQERLIYGKTAKYGK